MKTMKTGLKKLPFPFPNEKVIRVITTTDANNECDDQYCIAHLWMTPKFDNRAVISEHYGAMAKVDADPEQKSYEVIQKIAELMELDGEETILHGSPNAIADENTPIDSEGARFIVEEAMRDDPRPLFICTLGPLSTLASAYLMEPQIAERLTVIAIMGEPYPLGGFEFNQCNDLNAANVIIKSDMPLWQVPSNAYTTMRVTFMQLLEKVYPYGEIGKYLVDNTMEFQRIIAQAMAGMSERLKDAPVDNMKSMMGTNLAEFATSFGGEMWSLGDSPVVGLMINNNVGKYTVRSAPYKINSDGTYDLSQPGSRDIRVYETIDSRFIPEDFFSKLHCYFG